jgi:hypothetical protein
VVVQKDKIIFKYSKLKQEAVNSITLDGSKKPKTVELTAPGLQGPLPGIYQLEGDTLKLCWSTSPDGRRPGAFAARENSGRRLLILKRKGSGSASARDRSANNLKQIGLAMHNYHDTFNRFPAHAIYSKEGKPLLSWRVMILPFIEENDLHKQFKLDEPWDSENNKPLLDRMPKIYAPLGGETKDKHSTFYQVFVGKGTIFDPAEKKVTFASITDGTSNTLFAAEAGEAVPWTKPEDLAFDPDKALPALGGMFKGGFHVLMADGSVHFLKEKFDENKMKLLIIRNDGQRVDVNDLKK